MCSLEPLLIDFTGQANRTDTIKCSQKIEKNQGANYKIGLHPAKIAGPQSQNRKNRKKNGVDKVKF